MSTNSGYSYKITITAEELARPNNLSGGSTLAPVVLQPPLIDAKRTPTGLTDYTVSRLHHFAFNKIVEPRFDGMGMYTGQPTNFPDFVSEHHIIGIMRATEICLYPRYSAMIYGNSNTTTA